MRHVLHKANTYFLGRSKTTIMTIVLLIIAAFAWLDYLSGIEITFSFFYLIPSAIAAWYIGRNSGFFISFVSMAVWVITNFAAGETFSKEIIRYWNASFRLFVFIIIIQLLEEFKLALHHERLVSHTDHLTGIPNSREFYIQANEELLRATRSKLPIAVAYIDVDSFKRINDQFGHAEGDFTLRVIAQTLACSVRQTDTIARIGGDEFAILLPNTDLNGTMAVMNKVQNKLMEEMMQTKSNATFSIGVITFTVPPASVDELLQKADEVMYKVKSKGKNGVEFVYNY